MISISVKMEPGSVKQITVELTGAVKDLQGLNSSLAKRLQVELVKHFRSKNAKPNKRGWTKSDFWEDIAQDTEIANISEKGATVTVADHRFRIHVTGGVIRPVKAKRLTIPLIPEARGLMASSYARKFNRTLFTIPGRNALFETVKNGTESVIGKTNVRARRGKRTLTLPLSARSTIRPVYALAAQAKIPADPTALPTAEKLQTALLEEAADWLDATLSDSHA